MGMEGKGMTTGPLRLRRLLVLGLVWQLVLMAGLAPPRVADKLVAVFAPAELTRLERACAGRSFAQRRDTAIIAAPRSFSVQTYAGRSAWRIG